MVDMARRPEDMQLVDMVTKANETRMGMETTFFINSDLSEINFTKSITCIIYLD